MIFVIPVLDLNESVKGWIHDCEYMKIIYVNCGCLEMNVNVIYLVMNTN